MQYRGEFLVHFPTSVLKLSGQVKESVQEILPCTALVLSRGSAGNENILQVRCRIYGLHCSRKFLFSSSEESSFILTSLLYDRTAFSRNSVLNYPLYLTVNCKHAIPIFIYDGVQWLKTWYTTFRYHTYADHNSDL